MADDFLKQYIAGLPDYDLPAGVTPARFDPNNVSMSAMPSTVPTNWAPYLTAAGGGMQFGAALMQGRSNAALARASAAIHGLQARSEAETGAEHAELYRQHLQQTLGKQTAAVGGANVTMSGSALRSLSTTAELGARDIAQLQTNALRKAWGFEVGQEGELARAGMESRAGVMAGLGSLITSGARAYGQWNAG